MKRNFRWWLSGAALLTTFAILLVAGPNPPTDGKLIVSPEGNQLTVRLQLECGSNEVTYVVQSSTNLAQWKTILAVRPKAGTTLSLGSFPTTNSAALFRLVELEGLTETNPPAWSNGVQSQFSVVPPAGLLASWAAATDDTGIAEYRLFLNGVLITNVLGTTLTHDFTLALNEPADIRIQAVDAFGNATDILSLVYLPGDKLLAVSDDSGRVYTSYIQTNGNFSAFKQIASYGANDRGLCLGDFDRDGLNDLIAGYPSGNTLVPFFYRGNGDGTFAPGVALPTTAGASGYAMDATAGDFDADGNLDFVFNGNERFAMFYWGNGNGTFSVQVRDWGDGGYYYGRATATGDFDEDGREDLARASCCGGLVKVFLSKGDRSFVETNLVAAGLGNNDPYAMAAGDFDEDGHLDLIIAGGSSGDVSFLKGLGTGSFTNITGTNGLWANLDINTHSGMDAFDYNDDGHLDLVMTANNGQAYFWAGVGDGTLGTNRVTLNTGMNASFGISAPPRPARVDVGIAPRDPVTNLNGTVAFTAAGAGVNAGDFFRWTFGDTGTNPYAWTFTADMTNQGPTVSHTYTNEGRFLTRLLHTDASGILSSRGTWVTVQAEAPVSQPGGPYVLGELAATQAVWYATLDGSSSSDDFGIVSYIWHFGDGTSVTNGPVVSHGWNGAGSWTIGLTVVDASGLISSNSTTLTFNPGDLPVAVISGPELVNEAHAINGVWSAAFNATNASDDVGIWKYEWNFGNGQTASGRSVTTTYNAVGDYVVTLKVTDHANQTNATTHSVTVRANDLPFPVITGTKFLDESVATNGLWFGAWNGQASTDDRGIYRYDWRFGDGATATGVSVTHSYPGVGVYPLVLTVTDFGNQSAAATQNVIVVANDFPVARITAGTLAPEGNQPVSLSGSASTDDHGIWIYRWTLPPQLFEFNGISVDASRWAVSRTIQDGRFVTSGQNSWDTAFFNSAGLTLRRGSALEGRVDTSSTAPSHAMIGFRNQDNASGNYTRLVHAVYFNNGGLEVYEYGNYRGSFGSYSRGTSYDFRIETKPGAGAIYYVRPSGVPGPFVKLYESSNYGDATFGIGGTVYSGEFGFDDLRFQQTLPFRDVSSSVFPGGEITLEVTDHALQTNTTSLTITPVTGTPPVAVINGPTNGLAGVALAFDGYNSSDDYAIASYTWDFGDGTPALLGPAVSHHYAIAGTYTNTLTVLDYAGQTSTASLVVTIAGANLLTCVPWRIIGGIEQPHEVYSGKTNTLKAVARGIPVPFTFIWNYGDGTGSVTNSVTNSALIYNLEAKHAYVASEGTPFYATIEVILTNDTVLAGTYPLVVRPKTLDTEMKVAIDEGLWHIHKTQNRYDLDTNNPAGDWTSSGYKISATASAVHAFGINGHTLTDDAARDPYVDTVLRGVNFLLVNLTPFNIGPQTYGDPDGNHNGIGLSANTSRPIYESGQVMDALVAAGRRELIARVGGANVKGRPFGDIMQDLVDQYCWGQYDAASGGGGWRYGWNDFPDNSASQWGAIGMLAARDIWGIAVPEWVIQRNRVWVAYSQRGTGFGYTGQDSAGQGPGGVEATTPSALVQMNFDGFTTTNSLWQHGENYLANNWTAIMNLNNVYANYAIAKAMRTALPEPVHNFAATGKDWFLDPVNGLARVTIDRQATDGSWTDYGVWIQTQLVTPWSVIILSSSLFQRGPVAVVNVRPNPSAIGYPVVFDARSSYHQHPAYKIAEYHWDFNAADGIDFEHPDAVGPVVTNSYGALSTNSISLRVRDNASPALADIASVLVRTTVPPFPPTADAGGPYVASVGQDIHLDGSGSFAVDEASGNFIQSWNWETDFLVPLDFSDDLSGRQAVITNGFPTAGPRSIGLRVKNANSIVYPDFGLPDLTADAFTTVYVYDRVINDLRARPKGNKIQLTWTKVGDYAIVHRSTLGPDRGFTEVGRTDSSYATFLDTDTEYNIEYYYRIFAYANSRPDALGVSDPEFIVSRQRGLEDHPPQFLSTPIRVALAGQLYGEKLDAKDPENDPIYFGVLSGPTNLTVNASSGVIQFLPTANQIGSHALSFEATNAAGRDVLSFSVFVFPASNHPPVASVNGPYAALTGETLQFSSAGTSDPDGDRLIHFWNFGDGQSSTNSNPTHVYNAAGDYLITLFVNDGYGGTASARTHAQIRRPNRAPVALVASGPHFDLRLGETLALDGSGSYDLDGDPLTFSWSWGDGTSHANGSLTATHTYAATGQYFGRLQVADNRNGEGHSDFDVTVGPSNQPPVIVLLVSSNTPFAGTVVTFDASATTDPEGDDLAFEWDFGDRSKTTGSLVTHIFQQISDFTVTLKVTDSHGGVATTTQPIQALNSPPTFTSTAPLLIKAGLAYTYTPTLNDLNGDGATFSLEQGPATMSFDPGTGKLDWLPGTNDLGPNAVVLRATDSRGAAADQSFNIVVTTPTGPEVDLEPTGLAMTNVSVNSESLALTGTIKVTLKNHGADPVPIPFTVSVFVDADFDGSYGTNTDRLVGFGIVPAGLAQGFVGTIELGLSGQALFKDAPLSVFVDSERVVPEYDENNNLKRSGFDVNPAIPPVIDLSASALLVDRSALPTNALLTARLGNAGFVTVPANVPVAFYDGSPQSGGTLIGVATNKASLAPGAFEDVTVTWAAPTIAPHIVFVVADDPGNGAGLYTEITETNNGFSTAADLTANEPPVANAGEDVAVYVNDSAVLNGRDSRDPENKPLSYLWSMRSVPIGSQAQLTGTTSVQPFFQPDVAGEYTVQLVVNDGAQNSTNAETVKVTAVDTNANNYPAITSTPAFQGMATVPYQYAVLATDPDGDALNFSLAQAPAGMVLNPNTGLLQWTTTNTGNFFVQVNVFDSRGAGIFQSWSLTMQPYQNLAPQFTSTPVPTAAPGAGYTYNADATDANNDTVTYALTVKPSGMSINASSGVINWTPTSGQLGGHAVTVTANDGKGGNTSQAFNVVVFTPGQDGPVVQPMPDQTVVTPTAFASIPLDVYVFDPNHADNQITWTVTGNTNLTVTIDANRVATVTYPPGTLTSERLTFLATDPEGKSAFAAPLLAVRGADNPPVAAIANLSDSDTTVINTGTFELKGTAEDPDAIDAVAYRVVLYDPATGNQIADLTPGPVNAAGLHEGRVAADGSLGTLDFTMVRNGAYTLLLEVHGGNLVATATVSLALDSALKLGQVTFAQQDVVFPIGGVGLQIIRSYDSLNPAAGDFGYSWTYSVTDIGLSINEQRVQEQDLFGEFFSLRTGGGRDVTLTMPDSGQRVTFKYSLVPGSFFRYRAIWTPPPGLNASLVPLGSANVIKLFSLPAYWEAAGLEVDIENFDFPGFTLTTGDGTQYRVDRQDLGEHFIAGNGSGLGTYVHAYGEAHLTRINQPTGDRTEFVQENGVLKNIEQFNKANEKLKSILFQRNAEKRISAVYAPENLDSNGVPAGPAAMAYDYDAAGNLIRANKLQSQTDPLNPVYATTSYLYGHPRFPHFITEVKDQKGISIMRFEYDLQGRLVATYDAYGNKRALDHDLRGHTSTTFDALGNATVYAYDDRGNVIAQTDPLGATTRFTYNTLNQITSVSDPLGNRSTFTFGPNGEMLSRTDPLGNTTSYASTSNQFRITDPLGRITTQTFNAAGKLAAITDAAGSTMNLEYDSAGNPIAVINAHGVKVAEATFDSKGRFTASSNFLGIAESVGYDGTGNPTRNSMVWRGQSGTNASPEFTWTRTFDSAGNKLTDTAPDGKIIKYEYDIAGRRTAATDTGGNRATYLYDSSGKIIQVDLPGGIRVRNVFDANGRLVLTTDKAPVGSATGGARVLYDAAGRPVRVERIESVVINVVTQQNLLTTVFAGSGPVTAFYETNYDAASRVIGVVDSTGRGQRYEYDAAGRRTALLSYYGSQTNRIEFEYDGLGNLVTLRDPLGRETRYIYDPMKRRTRTIFHDGTSTRIGYSALGEKTNIVDQLGYARGFEYDQYGHLQSATLPPVPDPAQNGQPAQPRFTFHYDDFGHVDFFTDPLGRTNSFGYDDNSLQTSHTLPGGQREFRTYDAAERVRTSTDFNGITTEFSYDGAGRLHEKLLYNLATQSATQRVQYAYDASGRRAQVVDAQGTTTYTYDPLGRPSKIQSPQGEVSYGFDPGTGEFFSVSTPNTENHYDYDSAGRLSAVTVVKRQGQMLTQPETTTYEYNLVGMRSAVRRPNGITTSYIYDHRDRLVQLVNRDPASNILSSFSYTYRPNGTRSAATEEMLDAAGVRFTNQFTYAYDSLGRLTNEVANSTGNNAGYQAGYEYDLAGNRLSRTVTTAGKTLRTFYEYDLNNRLLSESNSVAAARTAGLQVPIRSFDATGKAQIEFRPPPSAWSYYAVRSLPFVLIASFGLLPVLLLPWRNWLRARSWKPGFDPRSSIWTASLTSYLVMAMVILPMDWRAAAAEADLFATLNTDTWGLNGAVTAYEYDANGAVTKKTIGGPRPETVTYGYDFQQHLVASTNTVSGSGHTNLTTMHYVYSDDGIRVGQTRQVIHDGVLTSSQNTLFIVDLFSPGGIDQVLEELPAVGALPSKSYTYGQEILAQTSSSDPAATQYLLADGHQSTRQIADVSGLIQACYSYDSYGLMLGGQPNASNPALSSHLFSGEYFDAQQQQYYLRARYYDPTVGRFTAEDPFSGDFMNPETLHKYAYCLNDPVNRFDPTGLFSVAEMAIVSSIIGSLALIGTAYALGDVLKTMTAAFPDSALLGVAGTIKGLVATPLFGFIGDKLGGGDFGGEGLLPSTAYTLLRSQVGRGAGSRFLQYSMLVVGLEVVYSMASAQSGVFFYFGEQLGTPSNSISVYSGLVWNMWNEEDYTGYFASIGGGAGNYGGGFFADPTDGAPWGFSFTFLSKSDSAGFGGGGNVTFYYKLYQENFTHQAFVIPAFVGMLALVTGVASKNAVAGLCGGILGIGAGYYWYKVKELPSRHGSDSSGAAYQFYLDQRQNYKRPATWNTGSPEPDGGLEPIN